MRGESERGRGGTKLNLKQISVFFVIFFSINKTSLKMV